MYKVVKTTLQHLKKIKMKQQNEPFRLTLEHFDTKITIERPYSEINIHELKEMMRSLALAAGFHEDSVDKMLPD